MISTTTSYEDFDQIILDTLAEFREAVREGIRTVADEFNRRVAAIPDWERVVKPWLLVQINRAVDALESKFLELWEAFEEKVKEIKDWVSKLVGNPPLLMEVAQTYIRASSLLSDVGDKYLPEAVARVMDAWSGGEGPDAFERQAKAQAEATSAVTTGVSEAATACGQAAEQIAKSWNEIYRAVLAYAGRVVNAIVEATDAGKILTFDSGPAIKLYADAAITVGEVSSALLDYVIGDVTAGEVGWSQLESKAAKGLLTGNKWPTISGYDGADFTNRSKW